MEVNRVVTISLGDGTGGVGAASAAVGTGFMGVGADRAGVLRVTESEQHDEKAQALRGPARAHYPDAHSRARPGCASTGLLYYFMFVINIFTIMFFVLPFE